MNKYLMAIDAGTGSVRALIFDLKGRQIAVAQEEWEHHSDPRYPGSMDFDWEKNWQLTLACIQRALREAAVTNDEIQAISTCCMREGLVLYDEHHKEIWACANVDARASDEVVRLKNEAPDLEAELYERSGQSFALDAIPRLLWVKKNLPELFNKVKRIGMFNDWLSEKLCGVPHVEPSNGSTTGLINLETRNWDQQIFNRVGLSPDLCPPLKECGEYLGEVTKDAAQASGLKAGTPVIVGGGDAQVAALGVGLSQAKDAAIFGGSFWQLEYNTSKPKADPEKKIRLNCHVVPNLWQYEAISFQPGLCVRWFRDVFCQAEKIRAKEEGRSVYDLLNEMAADVPPGSHGLVACFSDEMDFLNWRHAAPSFCNFQIDPARFHLGTFYRALMESAAFTMRGNMARIESATGERIERIIFASGAANSPLWAQILADVLERPVDVPEVKEASGLGTAMLAGYGVGIYSDLHQASEELVKIEQSFTPIKEHVEQYQKAYKQWNDVYQVQLDLADRGVTESLWRAPGC